MPAYQSTPASNNPPQCLQPGVPGYAFGSKATGQTTLLQITKVAITGNVATITVLVREGNIPVVGQLISITGTSQLTPLFNVSNIAISGVSIVAATGVGTITFALVHADVVAVDDNGQGYVPVNEVGETLVNASSIAFAMQEIVGQNANARTITWSTMYPSAPTSVTMTLQASLFDIDAQYQSLDSSTNTAGDERQVTASNFRFLRVVASAVVGGTSPTSIVKVMI